MTADVFSPAISEMVAKEAQTYGPRCFADYIKEFGLPGVRTAQHLSVDTRARVSPSLRDAQTMVFRLGSPAGQGGSSFGLVRSPETIDDFFLIDSDVFTKAIPEIHVPDISVRDLFAYKLFPNLTEKGLVNLAFASGLLTRALGVTNQESSRVPATGQSTFTFDFQPHSEVDAIWIHESGQVEVDAVFVGRAVHETVFVVEAKVGALKGDLAKHKLVYPCLAIADSVPRDMEIVPVYVKISKVDRDWYFYVCICDLPDPREGLVSVDSLAVKSARCLVLPGFGL